MIVVGADGSQAGVRAVEWAAREAALREVPLRVVHALTDAWALEAPSDGRLAGVADWIRKEAGTVLDQARTAALAAAPGIAVTTAVLPGDPRRALIEAAGEAELLVVGNHGLGGFRGLLVGSVALGVAGHAPCDVVVTAVREQPAEPSHDGPPQQAPARPHIVAGVDGSPHSQAVLAFAFAEAAMRGAGLRIVHAESGDHEADPSRPRPDRMLSEVAAGLRERNPDVKVEELVLRGHPVDVLRQASTGADLLVVGSHGHGDFAGLILGSVSQAMLHHTPCPMAVVRVSHR